MVETLNGALRRVPVWPLYILGFVPAAWYLWLGAMNRLGADPVRELEHQYGLLALQLLIAALCVTPLRELTRINLFRFRRWMGLMAFYYAALHLAVWLVLDRRFAWTQVLGDLTKRPYVIVGMAAFLMLIPLALTSNNWAMRRLGGPRWRRLHRLAYPATALAALHFVWLVKAWPLEPLAYAAGVAALLGYRVARARAQARGRTRVRPATG